MRAAAAQLVDRAHGRQPVAQRAWLGLGLGLRLGLGLGLGFGFGFGFGSGLGLGLGLGLPLTRLIARIDEMPKTWLALRLGLGLAIGAAVGCEAWGQGCWRRARGGQGADSGRTEGQGRAPLGSGRAQARAQAWG